MPLSPPNKRSPIHTRTIEMNAYVRDDGLFDIEARLRDTKPFPFKRVAFPEPLHPGTPLHDLWVRLTLDSEKIIVAIEASSDSTPFELCKSAESTLNVLLGEQVGAGWSKRLRQLLGGTQSCTHLMEMLIPMATTAYQGINGYRRAETGRDMSQAPGQLNKCYAFASDREVVATYWPAHANKE